MSVPGALLDVFRVLASCTSTMMILSPLPTVYRIHKTQETGHMSIFPLLAVVFNCHTWMLYGYLDENFFPVLTTFGVGVLVAAGYVATFYRWTSDRAKAHRLLAIFACMLVAATAYAVIGGSGLTGQTRHEAAHFSGFIAISSSLVLYTSPLEKILLVFKHKSAVFIPIHMVIAGAVNNTMWIIYTSLARKWLMFVPNVFTLSVGLFQIVLYFLVYNPKAHPYIESKPRRSTATTEDDDDDDDDDEEEQARAAAKAEVGEIELETGDYVTIQTPIAALTTPEMQV